MKYLDMRTLKYFFFFLFVVLISSLKVWADLPLPMSNGDIGCVSKLTEMQEVLLTGDSILLTGFVVWIAYIVFCFPRDTLKKL